MNLTFRLFITYLITFRCVYCAHHIKFVLMIRLKEVEGLIFEFTTSSSPYILWHHEEHCTIFEDRKIMPYLCFCSDKTRDIITTVAFIIDYMKWSSFAVNQRKMFVFYEFFYMYCILLLYGNLSSKIIIFCYWYFIVLNMRMLFDLKNYHALNRILYKLKLIFVSSKKI